MYGLSDWNVLTTTMLVGSYPKCKKDVQTKPYRKKYFLLEYYSMNQEK